MKCLDTHALVEIANRNSNFLNLLEEEVVIPNPTMAEFYYVMYRDADKNTADYWAKKLKSICVNVDVETLIKASKYRYEHKKENLSFFDCVGYVYSLSKGMKFVTGDKQFKNKKRVEYIK